MLCDLESRNWRMEGRHEDSRPRIRLDPAFVRRIWIKFLRSQQRRLLGANYGPGVASHPLAAKILMHGLANVGAMKVAEMMHVFVYLMGSDRRSQGHG